MNAPSASDPTDPLFLALAQPVLRGPGGQAFTVVPATGARAIAARAWPRAADGSVTYTWAHAEPHEACPWIVTSTRLLALVDGHRPLTIELGIWEGWGGQVTIDTSCPIAVSAPVGGLTVFFINDLYKHRVRVIAVDAARAVELPPLKETQIYAAWECAGQLWAAGMVPRSGLNHDFGRALLLRWDSRPLAVGARWQGSDLWPVDASSAQRIADEPSPSRTWFKSLFSPSDTGPATLASTTLACHGMRMQGVEAWLSDLPGATAGERWLLGAPLMHGMHDYGVHPMLPELSPFWMMAPRPCADEFAHMVLARMDGTGTPPSSMPPPLLVTHLLGGHSLVRTCRSGTGSAWVFSLPQENKWTAKMKPHQLHVSEWDGAAACWRSGPRPLAIRGLPPGIERGWLEDFDVLHHPDFGFAAALTWQIAMDEWPDDITPAPSGLLLHSADGQQWQVVQTLRVDEA